MLGLGVGVGLGPGLYGESRGYIHCVDCRMSIGQRVHQVRWVRGYVVCKSGLRRRRVNLSGLRKEAGHLTSMVEMVEMIHSVVVHRRLTMVSTHQTNDVASLPLTWHRVWMTKEQGRPFFVLSRNGQLVVREWIVLFLHCDCCCCCCCCCCGCGCCCPADAWIVHVLG